MRNKERQAGFVLYAVLGVTALLASTYVGISLAARGAAGSAAITGLELDRAALTQAGLDMAGYQLFGLGRPPAAVDGLTLRFDAGEARLSVVAESGKADLNGSPGIVLAAAYRASGIAGMDPVTFAASVTSLRRSEPGGPPRIFTRLEQLTEIGLSPADIAAVARFVTVFNPVGQLSLSAVDPALAGALPGIDAATVSAIAEARGLLDEAARNALLTRLAQVAPLFTSAPPDIFRVRISAFTRGSEVAAQSEAVLIRSPDESRPYRIVAWQ